MKDCLSFLLITFLIIGCKNPQDPGLWSEVSDSIRLRIWTDKTIYQDGEDIWLNVEFNNMGFEEKVILISHKQDQMPERAPLYDIQKIIITKNDSRASVSTFEITPVYSNMFSTVPDLLKLQPGQTYKENTKLNSGLWNYYHEKYKRDPFNHVEPGKYKLKAIYTWDELPYPTPERVNQLEQLGAPLWNGYLESNEITIRIISKN